MHTLAYAISAKIEMISADISVHRSIISPVLVGVSCTIPDAQNHETFPCSHTQTIDADEDSDFKPQATLGVYLVQSL